MPPTLVLIGLRGFDWTQCRAQSSHARISHAQSESRQYVSSMLAVPGLSDSCSRVQTKPRAVRVAARTARMYILGTRDTGRGCPTGRANYSARFAHSRPHSLRHSKFRRIALADSYDRVVVVGRLSVCESDP